MTTRVAFQIHPIPDYVCDGCGPVASTPSRTRDCPPDWRGRPQVLRAYDRRGWIHDSTRTHDGQDPETAIAAMLANPEVAQIHSRNITFGCYMFAIARRGDTA